MFCGQDLLTCVLSRSDRNPASLVTALLKRLVDALRQASPRVCIIGRGDKGFGRPGVLRRLDAGACTACWGCRRTQGCCASAN